MKARSLWQPWASLIAAGIKHYETSQWPTSYRGPLAIHAAALLITDVSADLDDLLERRFGLHWQLTLPRSAIVATCVLTECIPSERAAPGVGTRELLCGNFRGGRYAWKLDHIAPVEPPIAFAGRQGLFEVPRELLQPAVAGGGRAGDTARTARDTLA
jgi:activating signal cointegrator 1